MTHSDLRRQLSTITSLLWCHMSATLPISEFVVDSSSRSSSPLHLSCRGDMASWQWYQETLPSAASLTSQQIHTHSKSLSQLPSRPHTTSSFPIQKSVEKASSITTHSRVANLSTPADQLIPSPEIRQPNSAQQGLVPAEQARNTSSPSAHTIASHNTHPEPLTQYSKPQEEATIPASTHESDRYIYEKKLQERLFPRPYQPALTEELYTPKAIHALESRSSLSFRTHILYPSEIKSREKSWHFVSILHSSSGSVLTDFIQSVIDALETRLKIAIGKLQHFQDIKGNTIRKLSLSDRSLVIFIGEPHQLSLIQSFLQDMSHFQTHTQTGFTPCIYLGRYFDTHILFLPIENTAPTNVTFKQELWRLLKNLSA